MLERARGVCAVAVTAVIIAVPVFGVTGASGHDSHALPAPAGVTAAGAGQGVTAAGAGQSLAGQSAGAGQNAGEIAGRGVDSRQGAPAFSRGRDTGALPSGPQPDGASGPQPDGSAVPPGDHGRHIDDQTIPVPPLPNVPAPPAQPATPPAPAGQFTPPPTGGDGSPSPVLPPGLERGNGNGNGNAGASGQGDSNDNLDNGPGDAHGNGNGSSAPGVSGRGTGSSIPPACDGLCHGGSQPSLSPGTSLAAPVAAVTSTPTPPPSSPPPTTSSPTPSSPSTPSRPPAPHTFTISPSPLPSTGGGPATGVGTSRGVSPVFSAGGAVRAVASSAGLGILAPATGAVGLAGAHGTTGAPTQHGANGSHHRSSSSFSVPAVSQAVTVVNKIINVVPEGVWIALAAALAMAAVATGAAFVSRRRANRQANELAAVSAVAMTDPLTGVLNRRGFTEAVERELARARRYNRPFVLAYVDVRGLKNVNDTEGHLAGDELLKSVAAMLSDSARADDVVGRLGGDELGLLLVEQTPDAAKAVTRRIEGQVPIQRDALGFSSAWDLTIGSAAFPQDGQTFDELLATADRRLYQQRGIELTRA